jgi:tetratricopeptide (TPR) repeat protein
MGNQKAAIRHYRSALELNPNYGVTRHNLGVLFFKQGQYEKAAENLKVAAAYLPNCPSCHYLFGMSLLKLGKKERGLQEIAEAIRLDPARKDYRP